MDLYSQGLARQLREAREKLKPRADRALDLDRLRVFPEQRRAILDPARERVLAAGRRSGKTAAECIAPIWDALAVPRSSAVYLSTSIQRAMDTVWSDLLDFLKDGKIPHHAKETTRTIRLLDNGSRIWVSGAETKKQANNIRGRLKRTKLVVIDETQDWKPDLLRYLYQVVVWPTLADVGGRTMLAGTGTAPRGFWYEHLKQVEKAGNVHRWTMFDNPHVLDARATLAKALADKGLDATVDEVIACSGVGIDAEIAQEYFCKFIAGERQIFHVSREKNVYEERPKGEMVYVHAIDLGTIDKFAHVVWGWTATSPKLHLIAYKAEAGLSMSQYIDTSMELLTKYPPLSVVVDPAAGGAAFVLDLQNRFGLPAEAAEKDGKVGATMMLRDALRRGEVVIPLEEFPDNDNGRGAGEFLRALETPEWDVNQPQKAIKGHMPDLCDAAIYGFRKARHFDYFEAPPVEDEEARVLRLWREEQGKRNAIVAEILGAA